MHTTPKRLAWLSPYGPRSDIGAFTRNLVPHLAAPHEGTPFDVHLWVNENGETYGSSVPQIPLSRQTSVRTLLGLYDYTLINVGNNVENHLHIANALRAHAGVLVFHDYVYQHFFAHECFESIGSPLAYARLMGELYGQDALEMVRHSGITHPGHALYAPWDSDQVSRYPMFELMTGLAGAVVVHSEFAEAAVRRSYRGPVLRLALPFDQKPMVTRENIADWQKSGEHKPRLQFTSFGHISRAKLLDKVLLGFAASPYLRAHGRVLIAGHPGDAGYLEELRSLVRSLQIDDQVSIELSVSDARLLQIKSETDVFLNLRWPNTEAGSGSLTEQLNTGRPVIVHDSGCYAEVPEGAAIKWSQASGLEALTGLMEQLARDPQARARVGDQGLQYVQRIGGEVYARELKSFLFDTQRRLHALQAGLGDRVGSGADDAATPEDVAQVRRTRDLWQSLEIDAFCFSPAPFLKWAPEAAATLASLILRPRNPAAFHATARAAIADSPLRFYESLSAVRTALRVAQAWAADGEAPLLAPQFSTGFWELATALSPADFAAVLRAALVGRPAEPATVELPRVLEARLDGRLVVWAFLHSDQVEPERAPEQQAALAAWALGDESRLALAQRVLLYLQDRGALKVSTTALAQPLHLDEADFDEQDYLLRHPDVQGAVRQGMFRSGYDHFTRNGRLEGRSYSMRAFDLESFGGEAR